MKLLQDCQVLSSFEIIHLQFSQNASVEKECYVLIGQLGVVNAGGGGDRSLQDQYVSGSIQCKYLESIKKKVSRLNHIPDVTVFYHG